MERYMLGVARVSAKPGIAFDPFGHLAQSEYNQKMRRFRKVIVYC